jgi:hypothetical protein
MGRLMSHRPLPHAHSKSVTPVLPLRILKSPGLWTAHPASERSHQRQSSGSCTTTPACGRIATPDFRNAVRSPYIKMALAKSTYYISHAVWELERTVRDFNNNTRGRRAEKLAAGEAGNAALLVPQQFSFHKQLALCSATSIAYISPSRSINSYNKGHSPAKRLQLWTISVALNSDNVNNLN